jgi:hypothetical protein
MTTSPLNQIEIVNGFISAINRHDVPALSAIHMSPLVELADTETIREKAVPVATTTSICE